MASHLKTSSGVKRINECCAGLPLAEGRGPGFGGHTEHCGH